MVQERFTNNFNREKEQEPLPYVTLNGQKIEYTTVSNENQGAIEITLENTGDQKLIEELVSAELQKQFWFLSAEFQNERLKEKFVIQLADDVATELYNFRDVDLTEKEIEQIAGSLKKYYQALKDKSQWRVKSIQIRSKDTINPLNGEPYYGMSNEDQRRFELYPASFQDGRYEEKLNVSSLEAVVLHEPNHINFQREWALHAATLGWQRIEDAILELPGGERTNWYNTKYEACPTEYAALYPHEDIPESVAVWFLAPDHLSETRKKIIEGLFNREDLSNEVKAQVTKMPPEMPALQAVTVLIKKPEAHNLFGEIIKSTPGTPPLPIMTIQQYRESRNK